MTISLPRAVTAALCCVWFIPGIAGAQTAAPAKAQDKGLSTVVFGLATFGRPLQLAGGADALFLIGPTKNEDGLVGSQGIVFGGNFGLGGWQVSAGAFKAGLPAFFSVRATYTETFKHARVSDPKSTYVGASASFTILYFIQASVGVDRRIRGTGDRKALYVWSIGAQIPLKISTTR